MQTLRTNNLRILRIKNAKFSGVLTKTWNDLKQPETTYNEQETTRNDLQRARNDPKRPEMTYNEEETT